MRPVPDIYEAEKLLLKALGREANKCFPSELRQALFECAGTTLGLLAFLDDDEHLVARASRRLEVDVSWLKKALELDFANYLRSFSTQSGRKKPPSAVGVHFVDPEIGRFSRIWVPPARGTYRSRGHGKQHCDSSWSRDYSELWLRVYRRLPQPSTSFINAFERELLRWPGRGLHVHWAEEKPRGARRSAGGASEKRASDPFKTVSLLRPSSVTFISETREAVKDLHKVLTDRTRTGLPDVDSAAFEVVADQVVNDVKRSCFPQRLADIREAYIRTLLKPGRGRAEFFQVLEDLGGGDGRLLAALRTEVNGRAPHLCSAGRRLVTEGVEILQTILLNEPGFCDERGLLLLRGEIDSTSVFLLMGFEGTGYAPNLARYSVLDQAFQMLLTAVAALLKKADKPPRLRGCGEDLVVSRALELLRVNERSPDGGHHRFLRTAVRLAREAIHEGRHLRFLLGIGHAETPELRCADPIRPLRHLTGEGVDIDVIVHFIKSYFSLFSRSDGLLWFDQSGRFHGLYRRGPNDVDGSAWSDWGKDTYFVQIHGKGRLDVLEQAELESAEPPEHRPRVRIVGDEVTDLQSAAAIKKMTSVASAAVFGDLKAAPWFADVVWQVIDRLREIGHGAGLVIANMDLKSAGKWRLPLLNQVKSLVPDLDKFREPAANLLESGNRIEVRKSELSDTLCRLAELDGAVFISLHKGIVTALPARHFFPLVGDDGKSPRLLNFYKWAEEGAAILKSEEVKRLGNIEATLKGRPTRSRTRSAGSTVNTQRQASAETLVEFELLEDLKVYAACIAGHSRLLRTKMTNSATADTCRDLSFLTSAGTRHHSLWGITLSSKEKLFVVSLSQDGRVSVFWDGRRITVKE